ncbi:invasion associated locus B family protein [Roseococcus sp. YIM B11640]|uniref:invasion associated locus B family protein n=1 Tax=Roseococcus sp. YIM B11640 TaxID=3133973 RepID=UPI003C7DFA52
MRFTFSVLLILALAAPASAQQRQGTPPARQAPGAAQAPADPSTERSQAAYGDWVLRCETRREPTPTRGCELLQSLQDQRNQPVAQFAFGRIRREDPLRLVALIPSNITVAVPMRLELGDGGNPLPVTLKACGPRGCVAEAEITAPFITRMRAREFQGRLTYRDALNGEVALPFSTRGFNQAMDALAREGF